MVRLGLGGAQELVGVGWSSEMIMTLKGTAEQMAACVQLLQVPIPWQEVVGVFEHNADVDSSCSRSCGECVLMLFPQVWATAVSV